MKKTKFCILCRTEKLLKDFNKNKRQFDGLHYYCRECQNFKNKEYRQKHPEKSKQYRAKNKERIKKKQQKYYQLNKEKLSKINLNWQQENKERYNKCHRNALLKRKYNISRKEYDNKLLKQNGVCAICHLKEIKKKSNGEIKELSVDHDHKTEKVRGLLCSSCNVAIGNFKDNIMFLQNAINYLKNFD